MSITERQSFTSHLTCVCKYSSSESIRPTKKFFSFNEDDAIIMTESDYPRINVFEVFRFNEDNVISMTELEYPA